MYMLGQDAPIRHKATCHALLMGPELHLAWSHWMQICRLQIGHLHLHVT